MSSFKNPHYFYLFDMANGKKKLAYGASPEDAYHILSLRLSDGELQQVVKDRYTKIRQRDLQRVVEELG
jgi:hypothetical protein